MTPQRMPLRELQREQTLSVIHHAAMSIALDEGADAATVRRIAGDAGVSERSVFNYYPVKEDAILGLRSPRITPDAAQRFIETAGRPLLTRTVLLMADVLRSANVSTVELSHRRTLLGRHPELIVRLQSRITDAEHIVRTFLTEQIVHERQVAPIAVVSGLAGAIIAYCLKTNEFQHFPEDTGLLTAIPLFRAALDDTPDT